MRFRYVLICVAVVVGALLVFSIAFGSDKDGGFSFEHVPVMKAIRANTEAAMGVGGGGGGGGGSGDSADAASTTPAEEVHVPVDKTAPVANTTLPRPGDDTSRQYVVHEAAELGSAERYVHPVRSEFPPPRSYHCGLQRGEDCCRRRDETRNLIWDTFTFNGDWEMFYLRLGQLSPFVDMFVLIQSNLTFGGQRREYVLPNDTRIANFRNCIRLSTILSNGTDGEVRIETVETIDGSVRVDSNSPWPRAQFRDAVELWFRDNTAFAYGAIGAHRAVSNTDWVIFSDLDEIYDPRLVVWLIERHHTTKWFYLLFKEYQYGYWNERPHHDAPGSIVIRGEFVFKYRMSALYYHGRRGGSAGDRCKLKKSKKDIKKVLLGQRTGMETACPFAALKFHPRGVLDAGWHCSNCFPSVQRILEKLCSFGWMLDILSTRGYTPETFFEVIKSGRIVHSTSSKQLKARYTRTDGWSTSPAFAAFHKEKFGFFMSPEGLVLGNFTQCAAAKVKLKVADSKEPKKEEV